jgi:hypothetical protein
LRESIYGCVASRSLPFGQFIKQTSQTNWDINELQSEHSGYVNTLVLVNLVITIFKMTLLIEILKISGILMVTILP